VKKFDGIKKKSSEKLDMDVKSVDAKQVRMQIPENNINLIIK
jgi:hypothetical protein